MWFLLDKFHCKQANNYVVLSTYLSLCIVQGEFSYTICITQSLLSDLYRQILTIYLYMRFIVSDLYHRILTMYSHKPFMPCFSHMMLPPLPFLLCNSYRVVDTCNLYYVFSLTTPTVLFSLLIVPSLLRDSWYYSILTSQKSPKIYGRIVELSDYKR